MVTAAAGSDAAVVLVDITKLDWQRRAGGAAAADAPPRAAGAPAARAQHRVRGQQARRGGRPGSRPSPPCATRCRPSPREAGIAVAGDRAGVGAARRQRHAAAGEASWYDGPSLLQVLESPARPPQERTTAPCCCRCSTCAQATGDGTGHQPRTLWGRIAHGRVQAGDAVQVFPSGERARWSALRRAGERGRRSAEAGQSAGLVLDRQLDVSRGDWIGTPGTLPPTQRFARHAGLARHRAGRDRPQVLAAPRQPLGAGAHHRHRPPARHPHAAAHRRARAGRQRDRPRGRRDAAAAAAGALRRQPRRRRADRRRPGQQPHQRRAAGRRRSARDEPRSSSSAPAPARPT